MRNCGGGGKISGVKTINNNNTIIQFLLQAGLEDMHFVITKCTASYRMNTLARYKMAEFEGRDQRAIRHAAKGASRI